MNPGDYVRFSVLSDSKVLHFKAMARVAGVSELSVVDKTSQYRKVSRGVPWTVYPVGTVSAFLLLLALLGGIPNSMQELRARALIRSGKFPIPEDGLRDSYTKFISERLLFTADKERKQLLAIVRTLPDGVPLSVDQQKIIKDGILSLVGSGTSHLQVLIFVMLLCFGGVTYIVFQLL
jgi:hypothetical protein